MKKTAILTISDKGSEGQRIDETGQVLREYLEKNKYIVHYYKIISDEVVDIKKELIYVCDELNIPLVITNGGTGFSKRDVTPEATLQVIEKYVPGIGDFMRMKSMEITPRAMLSRGIAGIRKNSLIINLPGSPRGAKENIEFILPSLDHGLKILSGETSECARSEVDL
ncbi:MogA/MoaB family molybdenum cofactor biosynthesis protein [Clostridium sp. UBA4395]|uniref:MogA/MoaB family molybdenum cofactor biosynthesis protein n=1 Tax=Clostridium sp. UBA4395 TaxID=1946360 RepID=UPI00321671BE